MTEPSSEKPRCQAIRKDGQPCALPAVAGGPCCFAHTNTAENRALGGAATANTERAFRMLPNRLKPLFTKLSKLYDEVHDGEVTPEIGRACAQIAGAMVRVLERGQIEERLQSVERAMGEAADERQTA